jgi:hypothetical protein
MHQESQTFAMSVWKESRVVKACTEEDGHLKVLHVQPQVPNPLQRPMLISHSGSPKAPLFVPAPRNHEGPGLPVLLGCRHRSQMPNRLLRVCGNHALSLIYRALDSMISHTAVHFTRQTLHLFIDISYLPHQTPRQPRHYAT